MSTPLSPALADQMRRRAQAVKDRMASSNFTKAHTLTGKNAVVEPGKEVTIRLAPRWDYMDSVRLDAATKKYVPNPDYVGGLAYVYALEHWWEGEGGKWNHEWCPRTFDEASPCAVCTASSELMRSASKEDREYGKKLQAKECFIFNAVVGDPRKVEQDGLADIRILSLNGVQFNAVSDIMTGGENEKAAYGDITSPRDGYDLVFKRPVKGGNDRWSVRTCGPNASPLYGPDQAAAFKGWATRLIDLEKMLSDETKDSAGIFRSFYGRDPAAGEMEGEASTQEVRQNSPAPPRAEPGDVAGQDFAAVQEASATESASEPESPDDAFMPPPPASQRAQRSPATPPGPGARTPAPAKPRVPRR